MKEKITYALIILLFSILVLSLALYYLFNGFSIRGDANIIKKYYDIKLNNVSVDYETDMTVKLDNENSTIQVKVPDLNQFKKTNSFSIDLTNIGNIDAKITEIRIENIFANIDTKNVNINLSLDKEDVIKGGETKKLNIEITYNGKDRIEQPYYEFSIKYVFDEVIL
ncbi:MAG: hypothetical protein SPI44_00960 [Bacilli bacterium]|nr:hypothetical protein [Bacilli bacterium]